MSAETTADKYIARDGGPPRGAARTVKAFPGNDSAIVAGYLATEANLGHEPALEALRAFARLYKLDVDALLLRYGKPPF